MAFLDFIKRKRKSEKWAAQEQKASAAGPVVAYSQVGRPRWTPRRYDTLAEEGFRRNVIAYRCVSEIARAAAAVPLGLYDSEDVEIAAHPALDLLARPNPLMDGLAFREAVVAQYLIAGNAYLEAVRPMDAAPPRELYLLRADRMKVIPGPMGLPQGYEYAASGQITRFAADPLTGASAILHWKTFHPLDDWYGFAPLEAAQVSIDQHNAAGGWNQSLLNQGARPSGALIYAPKDGVGGLSEDQFRRLKDEIEAQYQGARNSGRPLLLEGGLEWKEMSLSPKDMDWLEGRDRAARDIALAFGVPGQLIGLTETQTYANMAEARLAFYEETVVPIVQHFCAALSGWLLPTFGDGLQLRPDLDAVSALTRRRDVLWDKIGKADFLTVNEKRAALGYSPVPDGDGLPSPRPAAEPSSNE